MEITLTIPKTEIIYVHVSVKRLLRETSKVIVIDTSFFRIKLFRKKDGVRSNSL